MKIYVNGNECTLHKNKISNYLIYSAKSLDEKDAEIKICYDGDPSEITVRPLSSGICAERSGNTVTFKAKIPCKLSVESPVKNVLPVFIFLYEKEEVPTGENVRYFGPGEYVYDELSVYSGETLYLAEGAVIHAHLHIVGQENVTVCGRGIFDLEGEGYTVSRRRMSHLYECKNLTIRDVTFTGSQGWCCVLIGCENVLIDYMNIISWFMCGDGVDVVGSHDVEVKNCFMCTHDDCVSIKATDYRGEAGLQNVYNVKIHSSVMWNRQPGNGIEIGFETRCEEIYNIEFSNIDIIHCEHEGWQSGGTITIHNGDRAKIHGIVYRDIRVEDSVDKLFDFKVMNSSYSCDETRGSIKNVLVENVSVVSGIFPPSILSGFAKPDTLTTDIRFVNISSHGKYIHNMVECRMIAERTERITFEVTK